MKASAASRNGSANTPPPRKRQRYMDSYVKHNSLSAINPDTTDGSVLARKTGKEFQEYMASKFTMLRLDVLPSPWFKIIFDQNSGEDGGTERANSERVAHAIHEALMSEKRYICPQPLENIWKWALALPDPKKVRVVVIGQDPYHTVNRTTYGPITMADGLAFSVNPEYARLGKPLPPTLINIMKLADKSFEHRRYDETQFRGDLTMWTENGVLLLNSSLTTVEETPNAHAHIGWNKVTDRIVQWLGRKGDNENNTRIFMLWGKEAKRMCDFVDRSTHVLLTSCHPSPLSAYKCGWFEKDIFKQANLYLRALGHPPITWSCRRQPQCHAQRRKLFTAEIESRLSQEGTSKEKCQI